MTSRRFQERKRPAMFAIPTTEAYIQVFPLVKNQKRESVDRYRPLPAPIAMKFEIANRQ
jgi:hypothetical protein